MRLRAEMLIEIAATDFVEAADHEQKLTAAVRAIKLDYPQARFSLRTLRESTGEAGRRGHRNARLQTGNLADYTSD